MGYQHAGSRRRPVIKSLIGLGVAGWWAAWLAARPAVPAVVSITLSAAASISAWIWWRNRKNRKVRAIQLSRIDEMSGAEFERYLAKVLVFRGHAVGFTPASGDLGVDLLATQRGQSIAIQVKRSARPVSRRAVSDAVGAMRHYGCTSAMVVTNGYFTTGATVLAESTGCTLVDP